jgi:uncharacterized membrane protein
MHEPVKSASERAFIGVILQLVLLPLGVVPSIIGYMVEAAALYSLSQAFNNPAIAGYASNALITAVMSILALLISIFFLFVSFLGPSISGIFLGISMAMFLVSYVFILLSGRSYRNLYNELANSSGISEFRDAAKWTWLGALLFIVIVGAILALVGRIFALLGYNRLKEWKPPQQT